MGRLRHTLISVVAVAATAGGALVGASPASAAMPYCNNVSGVMDTSSGSTRYATYQTGTEKPSTSCDMNYYNENGNADQREAIRSVQWDLVWCYGQDLGPDGIDGQYGWYTREAVKNAQRAVNSQYGTVLTVDGWAGPNTRKWMNHVNVDQTFCSGVYGRNPVVRGEYYGDYWSSLWDIGTPFG